MTTFDALARGTYMELTTFRKTGDPVSNPVWLVADGAALLVITVVDSGKVKRIRHTPRVTMRPSDIRGRVKAGVGSVEGVAEIVTDAARQSDYIRLLRKKYGWQFRLAFGSEAKPSKRGRHVVLRITPA